MHAYHQPISMMNQPPMMQYQAPPPQPEMMEPPELTEDQINKLLEIQQRGGLDETQSKLLDQQVQKLTLHKQRMAMEMIGQQPPNYPEFPGLRPPQSDSQFQP